MTGHRAVDVATLVPPDGPRTIGPRTDSSDHSGVIDLTVLAAAIISAVLVAALRASDVLLGVLKTSFVVRGSRPPAALFAALEAGVWLAAAGIVFADPTPARAIGFVAGVAVGTWLGLTLINVAKLGTVTVRVFVPAEGERELYPHMIAAALRARGFAATVFEGQGASGRVDMILSVVRRRDIRTVTDIAEGADPAAFIAIDSEPATGWGVAGAVGVRP